MTPDAFDELCLVIRLGDKSHQYHWDASALCFADSRKQVAKVLREIADTLVRERRTDVSDD